MATYARVDTDLNVYSISAEPALILINFAVVTVMTHIFFHFFGFQTFLQNDLSLECLLFFGGSTMQASGLTLRVKTSEGMLRLSLVPSSTVADVKKEVSFFRSLHASGGSAH